MPLPFQISLRDEVEEKEEKKKKQKKKQNVPFLNRINDYFESLSEFRTLKRKHTYRIAELLRRKVQPNLWRERQVQRNIDTTHQNQNRIKYFASLLVIIIIKLQTSFVQ